MTDQTKPESSPPQISLHGGRDTALVLTELEPGEFGKAEIVTHARNQTQRAADRLFHAGRITADQHLAATHLRDDFENGWRGRLRAASWEMRVDQSGNRGLISAVAWELYTEALNQLSRDERTFARNVIVMEDMTADQWARKWRCHAGGMLNTVLDKLVKHYIRCGR